jgi:hypothetical protein
MSNFNKNIVVKFPETTFGSVFYEVRSLQTDPKSQHSTYKNATNSSFEFNRNLGMANSLTSSITLGYLDEFKNYETRFFVGDGNQTYYYFKRGAAPNSIVLPLTSKFTILDKTFDNFDFNAIGNFVSKSVSWHYYDPNPTPNFYFSWSVSSTPDYKQKLFELPSEFKKKYPVIQLEKLALVGASFIVKRSYDPKLDEYEEYSVSTW